MHINPRRLPILLAVHREGGIVAAADVLNISASAISQQVRRLEEEVGLALVERTPTGMALTPAGRVLVEGAERIEAELDRVHAALRPLAGQVTGTVDIGAFATVTRAVLLPALPDLHTELPGVEMHLHEIDETAGMTALRSGHFDALVIERDSETSRAPRGWEDLPFIDEPWVVVSPDSAPPVASLDDLARLQWLSPRPGMVGAEPLRRIASRVGGLDIVDFSYTTYEVALDLVRTASASILLPSMATVRIDENGLRLTPLPGLGSRRVLLRRRKGASDTDAAGQFLTRLREWAARNPVTGGKIA